MYDSISEPTSFQVDEVPSYIKDPYMALKKEEQELHDKMVAEWLAKGTTQYANPFARSDPNDINKFNRWKGNPKKRLTKRSNVLY